jgi:hypothetical protein
VHRHELANEDAVRILVGAIRNNVTTSTIFTPWHGLDLSIRDGQLHRTNAGISHFDRSFSPIVSVDELLVMTDIEIMRVVTGERMDGNL